MMKPKASFPSFEMSPLSKVDLTSLKTYNYILQLHDRMIKAKNDVIHFFFTLLFRIVFLATLVLLICGLSLFGAFVVHYQMLPTMRHVFPVHLQHSDCMREMDSCGYPTATISFLQGATGHEGPVLMAGQKYAMWVEMDLPESEVPQVRALP
jgi:hypothetical protein